MGTATASASKNILQLINHHFLTEFASLQFAAVVVISVPWPVLGNRNVGNFFILVFQFLSLWLCCRPAVEEGDNKKDDSIYIKASRHRIRIFDKKSSSLSVTMPISFMTGSVVGKRFYKQVTTRAAHDGNGWTVMLDYTTLKTPSKRHLKLPTLAFVKAIAAECEFQQADGIRPFTMPLMKLA